MCNLSAAPQVARCVRAQKTLAEASIRPITRRTSPIDTYRVLVVFTAVNQTTLPRGQLKEDRLETDTGPTLQRTGTIFNRLRTANTAPTVRRVKFIIFKTGRKRNKIHDFYLVLALTRADGYDPPNFQPNGTKLIRSDVLPVQMARRRCVHCIHRAYTFRLDVDGFAKKNPLCTQTYCTPRRTVGHGVSFTLRLCRKFHLNRITLSVTLSDTDGGNFDLEHLRLFFFFYAPSKYDCLTRISYFTVNYRTYPTRQTSRDHGLVVTPPPRNVFKTIDILQNTMQQYRTADYTAVS